MVLLLHPPGHGSLPLAVFTIMANAPEALVAMLCLFYVTLALAVAVAGQQNVAVEELPAVAGEVEEREVGAAGRGEEALRRPLQREGVAVEHLLHVEFQVAQPVGDRRGVALRVLQRRQMRVAGVADHQRHLLGGGRRGHGREAGEKAQHHREQFAHPGPTTRFVRGPGSPPASRSQEAKGAAAAGRGQPPTADRWCLGAEH